MTNEASTIPGGTEMTEENAAIYAAQNNYMAAKDKVVRVLQPWVVAINGVSLADEVATLTLAALDMVYPANSTKEKV